MLAGKLVNEYKLKVFYDSTVYNYLKPQNKTKSVVLTES